MKKFSIGEALSYGYEKAKANWKVLSPLSLMAPVLSLIFQWLTKSVSHNVILVILLTILSIAVGIFFAVVYTRTGILEGRGVKVSWKNVWDNDLVTCSRFFLTTIVVGLITFAVFVAGIIILAIGAYLFGKNSSLEFLLAVLVFMSGVVAVSLAGIRLRFSTFATIDGKETIESLKFSWNITRGNFWLLFGFFITIGFVNLAGAIVFIVGLLFTIPLSLVATGYVYNKLKIVPDLS